MKFIIDFLGCKVNSYEVEAIASELIKNGFIEIKKNINEVPDIVIINTCAVTETSSSKSKKMIKQYRHKYPNAIICVMGCFSQYEGKFIIDELKADIVLGTFTRDQIPNYINEFIKNKKPILVEKDSFKEKKYEDISLTKYFEKTRAYVKIQDGCNNFCTYCLIPYVRGRSRSRDLNSILNEINSLINNGYKEIILTGIDQGSYGLDFDEKLSFSYLIEQILINNPTLYRLRISSLEESQIDDKFLELLKKYNNIANHLHIPLQSGSKNVLNLMNRKYNLDDFKEKIKKIREIRSDISITTDVIVGFPNESNEDFLETYNFIKEIKFSKVHVFPYSDRKGTVASKMENKIKDNIKKESVNALLNLSSELEKEYEAKFYNTNIEFLFENYDKKYDGYRGHSSNYLECIYKSDKNIKDEIININFKKENSLLFFDNVKK